MLQPDKILVKLRYIDSQSILFGYIVGGGVPYSYVSYPVNNIYNLGANPATLKFPTGLLSPSNAIAGMLEYGSQFKRFRVLGMKMNVWFWNANAVPIIVGLYPQPINSANLNNWANWYDVITQPDVKWKTLAPAGTTGCTGRVSCYTNFKKLAESTPYVTGPQEYGNMPTSYGGSAYSGGAAPTDLNYNVFKFQLTTDNSNSSAYTITRTVITFYAELTGRLYDAA